MVGVIISLGTSRDLLSGCRYTACCHERNINNTFQTTTFKLCNAITIFQSLCVQVACRREKGLFPLSLFSLLFTPIEPCPSIAHQRGHSNVHCNFLVDRDLSSVRTVLLQYYFVLTTPVQIIRERVPQRFPTVVHRRMHTAFPWTTMIRHRPYRQ
jgi:hypothetical protein